MEEIYDFDDFFVSLEDPGIAYLVSVNGRDVPITVKRGIGLSDMKTAQGKAIITRKSPNGQPEIVGMDEEVFTVELLLKSILSWPFTRKNPDGSRSPVEITRETIRAMLGEGGLQLQGILTKQIEGRQAALVPFESPSGEGS